MSKSVFQQHYDDEGSSDKLSRKAKDSPFMVIGKCMAILHHICGQDAGAIRKSADLDTEIQCKLNCCVT